MKLRTNYIDPIFLFDGHLSESCPCPQTLLDLGASPNYKDSRGLTPLYHSAMVGGAPYCCELLLQDHAAIGTEGEQILNLIIHLF